MKNLSENSDRSFPTVLKEWRNVQGLSQLELALRSGSSQKHISFLESGRSNPSRIMIFSLCEALQIPLRDRNELLLAAGFAPSYKERSLDDPDLAPTKQAIDRILQSHLPYPAVVYDRLHNVMQVNDAAIKFQCFLYDVKNVMDLPEVSGNVLRGLLHPEGYREHIENWDELASIMLRRLRAEIFSAGKPEAAVKLLKELSEYPGIPSDWQHRTDLEWRHPMLTVHINKGGHQFSLFTTLTSLGAPFDVTLQEIRIESYFPLDDSATSFFSNL